MDKSDIAVTEEVAKNMDRLEGAVKSMQGDPVGKMLTRMGVEPTEQARRAWVVGFATSTVSTQMIGQKLAAGIARAFAQHAKDQERPTIQ